MTEGFGFSASLYGADEGPVQGVALKMERVCILTFEGNPVATELFRLLKDDYETFVLYTANRSVSLVEAWRRKRGTRWLWYNLLFNAAARLYGVTHIPEPSWKELKDRYPASFLKTDHHNSELTRERLRSLNLDLGVLIGTPLIRPEVFEIPASGMINLHQGNIPRYRGAPPAYWEHRNGEAEMFVTVHVVVKGLDAGAVLEEESFSIKGHGHFVVSKYRANKMSAPMLVRAVSKRLGGCTGEPRLIDTRPNTVPEYPLLLIETLRLLGACLYRKRLCKERDEREA